jgi:hypothetical protein
LLTLKYDTICGRMNGSEVQMTQGVSQMTSHSAVKLADELLNTKLMTIEDLIESNEVFIY